ncbi:MAG: hypothetical protein N4A62_09850 [Marinisporobacter sp.]|jgi:hypothetical protein|nr:hypothetical protein [Marinisporobacter sp.]
MFDFLFRNKKNNLRKKKKLDTEEDMIPEIEYKKKNQFKNVSEEAIAKAIKEALLKDKD